LLVACLAVAAGPATAEPPSREPPHTDLYGDPLPDGAVARFGTTRWKHPGGVSDLVYSPDGKTLVSTGDRTVRLWEAATGKELRRFVGHESWVSRAVFSHDGKTLVTADGDGIIRFWDVTTSTEGRQAGAKEQRRLVHPTKGVTALALAPDGKTLASGGRNGDQKIYLWDTASGKLLRSWVAHAVDVWVLAFSPDGKTLVSGGESNGQLVNGTFVSRRNDTYGAAAWDPATGKKLYEIGRLVRVLVRPTPGRKDDPDDKDAPTRPRYETHTDPERVAALAFSSDGKLLATGGYDPPHGCWTVRLWDAATGKEYRLDDGKSDAKAIAFSPDGKLLVAQDEKDLVFWDVARRTRLNARAEGRMKVPLEKAPAEPTPPQLPGDPLPAPRPTGVLPPDVGFSGVSSLAFSPDGKTLAAGLLGGEVKLWDVDRTAPGPKPRLTDRFEPRGHQWRINTVAVSPDGRLAYTGEEGPGGRLWELATGKEIRTFEGGWWYPRCAAFSPDGKILATGHMIGVVYLWDADLTREIPGRGKRLRKLEGISHEVVGVSFLRDGKTVVAHSVGSDLTFWDTATGKEIRKMEDRPTGFGFHPALSPDGRLIGTTAGLGDERGLYLWDAATGEQRQHLPAGSDQAGAFSPDGLVVASVGEQVRLWDVTRGLEIGRLQGGLRSYERYYDAPVAYAPDGRYLAAAEIVEQDGAHLWSVETGKDFRLDGGQGKVKAVAFSPDGKYFLTAGEDRNVLVWDVARVIGEPDAMPKPTAEQLRALVADLRGRDPLRAFQAFHRLARSPGEVVSVLRDRLRPAEPVDPERLKRLLRRLDSDDFQEREEAMRALRELGQPAESGLKQALTGERSAEVRKRVGVLLEELEQARKERRTDWAVRLLERLGTKEARTLLEALSRGTAGAPQTEDAAAALKRLDKPRRPEP
jgi:WD40 repeat protein